MRIAANGGVEVPPGEYIVGDPCYAVPGDKWAELLDSCCCFDDPIGRVSGKEVVAFGTAHGDGVYPGSDGSHYGVDAGLIGLVPSDMDGVEFDDRLQTKVVFEFPTICHKDGAMLVFGHISIDTDLDCDDE